MITRAGSTGNVVAVARANPRRFVLLRADGETFAALMHRSERARFLLCVKGSGLGTWRREPATRQRVALVLNRLYRLWFRRRLNITLELVDRLPPCQIGLDRLPGADLF